VRSAVVALALGLVAPVPRPVTAHAADLTFPFTTTFDSAAGGTLSGDATVGGGWLQLTSAAKNQAGAWSTNGVFPSTLGLEIEFRYAMHGGNGAADGIVLWLADGAAKQGVGQYGASMGYVCDDSTLDFGPCDRPGLPGAYVGIAFDRYGNFSRSLNGSGPGQTPDRLAIRGAGDGTTGYRFLRNAVVPNGVATKGRDDARVVRVTLLPTPSGHLNLTVRTIAPGQTDAVTVVDRVPLEGSGQGALPKTLRLGMSASTGSFTNVHEIAQLSVWLPSDLSTEHDMPRAVAGERYEYRVRARNSGPNAAAGSAIAIDAPPALTDVAWTCSADRGAACGAASGTAPDNAIRSTVDLPVGATSTFTVSGALAPDAAGELASTGEITPPSSIADLDRTNDGSRGTAPIVAAATLGTTKSVALVEGATELHAGDEVEYTVAAENRGPSTAADVGVRDELPAPLTFTSSTDPCTADGQVVTCSSGAALAPGESVTFAFRARLDAAYDGDGSDVENIAVATSPTGPGDPSEPVVLPPIEPEVEPGVEPTPGPSATAVPSPAPSSALPSPGPSTPAGRGDGAPPASGPGARAAALAFTGADGVAAAVGSAVVLVAVGALLLGMRRRSRAIDPVHDRE
jgi:uncharacterized repeat protein (TIGR01451 family)